MPNPFDETRSVDEPYAIYKNDEKGWEWRILATRKMPENEGSPFDVWYIAAKSPYTDGNWGYGDTYKSEVLNDESGGAGKLVECTPEWEIHYGHHKQT